MKTTLQALAEGFQYLTALPEDDLTGYWSYKFGDDEEYELCIEPLMFGQLYVALYKDGDLLTTKIPLKPIDKENELDG